MTVSLRFPYWLSLATVRTAYHIALLLNVAINDSETHCYRGKIYVK
jgi:hypothetical protein